MLLITELKTIIKPDDALNNFRIGILIKQIR